jgi:uncharacterized LabA/DUF88 family protein
MAERIAVFIDGANLHYTTKALGFEIDFERLLAEFAKRGSLLRAYWRDEARRGRHLSRSRSDERSRQVDHCRCGGPRVGRALSSPSEQVAS